MKLPELVDHTNLWLSMPHTTVGTFGRALREARLISVGTTGGGAADMTDDDKISLFVAVLGCGTARTCAKDLPGMLSLAPSKITKMSDYGVTSNVENPAFLSQPNLKSALLTMFRDIRSGTLEDWRQHFESEFSKADVTGPMTIGLTVTFEIDANHVNVQLRANGVWSKHKIKIAAGPDMEFGVSKVTAIAGYSRRLHEVSYDRLAGWGSCLTEAAP
jgi:hypothetical protein